MNGVSRVRKRLLIAGAVAGALGLLAFTAWAVMIACNCRPDRPPVEDPNDIATIEKDVRAHVQKLAGDIGERNVGRRDAYTRAADYIRDAWRDQGFTVAESTYDVAGYASRTLEVTIPGATNAIVLFGAHYDSVAGAPGANDNATGVAAMLAISRALRRESFKRTLRFVAFPNEEPPYFETPLQGSRVYAAEARRRGDKIDAMVSLETIGYFTDAPKSQTYPPPLNHFYPSTGNFIAIVGNLPSRALAHRVILYFREASTLPAEVAAMFGWLPGVGWSDHASFWEQGYDAVMATDTAPFRYPHYHDSNDTPDKIRYPELARVTHGFVHVARRLADE